MGHAGGALKGNRHLKAEDGTPMANAMLAALHGIGVDIQQFGDSTKAMDLNVGSVLTVGCERSALGGLSWLASVAIGCRLSAHPAPMSLMRPRRAMRSRSKRC